MITGMFTTSIAEQLDGLPFDNLKPLMVQADGYDLSVMLEARRRILPRTGLLDGEHLTRTL